jgi:hypothetical protein
MDVMQLNHKMMKDAKYYAVFIKKEKRTIGTIIANIMPKEISLKKFKIIVKIHALLKLMKKQN